ncbi:MAG: DUF983 domain-containing protein [Crocinitomix sp.]|nr:DUF983 domain-containing protein [Crocinitomix sp.]
MNRFNAIIKSKCPNCYQGEIYSKKRLFWFGKINDNCESCGHKFDKEPGFFLGAMYVSYGLVIAECVAAFVIVQFFFESFLDARMVPIMLGVILVMSGFNYSFSRVIWMFLFTGKGRSLTQFKKEV